MSERTRDADGLTCQERLFVDSYLACYCNGTEAARRAGYKGDSDTLKVQATRLLTRANVRRELRKLRDGTEMDSREVIDRLSEIGRASMEDFVETTDGRPRLRWDKAAAAGKVHLVRELRLWPDGSAGLKLHDPVPALRLLARYHQIIDPARLELPKDPDALYARLAETIARKTGRKIVEGTPPNDPEKR